MRAINVSTLVCEKETCESIQAAICLHCEKRLCVSHVFAHECSLLKNSTVELGKEADELANLLAIASRSVDEGYTNAEAECHAWKTVALERIEEEYSSMIKSIQSERKRLDKVGKELTTQLSIEVQQKLKTLRTQPICTSQVFADVQLVLENVRNNMQKLQWTKNLTFSVPLKIKLADNTKQEPQVSPKTKHKNVQSLLVPLKVQSGNTTPTSLDIRSELDKSIPWETRMENDYRRFQQMVLNTDNATAVTTSQALPIAGILSASNERENNKKRTTVRELSSQNMPLSTTVTMQTQAVKPMQYKPFKHMVTRFQDVSAAGDKLLEDYLKSAPYFHGKKQLRDLIISVLSFLEAWHKNKSSPTVNLILQRLSVFKKIIINDEEKLMALFGVQIFVNHHCNKDNSAQTIATVLQFFLEYQCISTQSIIEWYTKGAEYTYPGFNKAKKAAENFIDKVPASVLTDT
ncbi:unnamed protein product [Rotaria magnacalcarata]|uniref:Uncharacterized protein n=1 Tax=Rotaria magnacalcarata TaxID=392030 RepID=A0A819YH28_9BILA|nr:unnamed protein product [Rotaria magnacalcarata]